MPLHVSIRDAMLLAARDPSIANTFDALNTLGVAAIELEYSSDESLP